MAFCCQRSTEVTNLNPIGAVSFLWSGAEQKDLAGLAVDCAQRKAEIKNKFRYAFLLP